MYFFPLNLQRPWKNKIFEAKITIRILPLILFLQPSRVAILDDKYYLSVKFLDIYNRAQRSHFVLSGAGDWVFIAEPTQPEGATCVRVSVTSQFIYHEGTPSKILRETAFQFIIKRNNRTPCKRLSYNPQIFHSQKRR